MRLRAALSWFGSTSTAFAALWQYSSQLKDAGSMPAPTVPMFQKP
jgi:hypothetical protein